MSVFLQSLINAKHENLISFSCILQCLTMLKLSVPHNATCIPARIRRFALNYEIFTKLSSTRLTIHRRGIEDVYGMVIQCYL